MVQCDLESDLNTQVNVGKPQVVYREILVSKAKGSAVFEREISGKNHYAAVSILLEPLSRGEGICFESTAGEDQVPAQYIPAIENGIRESLEGGYLKGYPLVDVSIVLQGGSFDERSSELAFSVCASMACKDALEHASLRLLEPIMAVE